MCKTKEKPVCTSHPKQLELLRRWRDALEGSHRVMAYELMNQVLEGMITNEKALLLLDNKRDGACESTI